MMYIKSGLNNIERGQGTYLWEFRLNHFLCNKIYPLKLFTRMNRP